MMMHHDEETAIRRGIEGANFFGYSLGHYYVFGEHSPGRTDVWQEYLAKRGEVGYDPEVAARALKEETLGAKLAAGDTTGAARRHRHARAGAPRTSAATRRPASTR